MCRLLSIEDDDWLKVPAMVAVFETAAVVHLAREIVLSGRFSRQVAIDEACRRLGVNPKTVASRLWRFRS